LFCFLFFPGPMVWIRMSTSSLSVTDWYKPFSKQISGLLPRYEYQAFLLSLYLVLKSPFLMLLCLLQD
jgi:hypothetical protein